MYRLRFATYYENHPEYLDISKIKDSGEQKTRFVHPIPVRNEKKSATQYKENTKELKTIMCNIEINLEQAFLNLQRSTSHLQYVKPKSTNSLIRIY